MAHLCYLSFVYYPYDCNVFSVERLLFNLCSDFFTMHGEGKKVLIYLILLKNRTPRIEKNKKEEYKRSFTRKVLRNRTLCYKKSRYQLLSLFATFFFYYTYISHSTFWYLHASYLSKKKKIGIGDLVFSFLRKIVDFYRTCNSFLSPY